MLTIQRDIFELIVGHAKRGLPYEVCGYLAEREGTVAAHYRLSNIDAAANHFSMKPEEQFAAVKDMRANGLKLRGVYHSHPETPARPSLEDIRLAYDPEISYVIVSLAEAEPSIKSFRISRGEVTEEQIKIIER